MDQTQTQHYQRIEFLKGQLLRARDMDDLNAYESALRALHVVGLHNTWGVAEGLVVNADSETVTVYPGIAYNVKGYEILHPAQVTLTIPPGDAPADQQVWYDLTIARPDELPRDLCAGVAQFEQAEFRWHRPASPADPSDRPPLAPTVRLGEEVPIARFLRGFVETKSGSRTVHLVDYSTKRSVRALRRPKIVHGQVTQTAQYDNSINAWRLDIDTVDAGFTFRPHYFVQMLNHPLRDAMGNNAEELASLRSIVGPFVSVIFGHEHKLGIAVRFGIDPSLVNQIVTRYGQLSFDVSWVGIESNELGIFGDLYFPTFPIVMSETPIFILDTFITT
jgi:hypothetical protein